MTDTQGAGPAFSPIKVFLALLAVIAVIVGIILATSGDESDPGPELQPNPGFKLTDDEAIDRFIELHELNLDAFRTRDMSLVSRIYTPDSPTAERIRREIRTLINDSVTVEPQFETEDIRVISNEPSEVVLQHTVITDAKFFDEDGRDITDERKPERHVTRVTLHGTDRGWLIYESLIIEAEPVPRGN